MRFIVTFIWLVFISVPVFSQSTETLWKVEDGWKGLLPFQSTKADAEKLFGKGIQTGEKDFFQYQYNTEDAVFKVDYAGKPCNENSDWHDRFDIPENTILRYNVRLKRLMPTTSFKFNKNRFERSVSKSKTNEPLPYFAYHQFKEELWKAPNEWSAGIGIEFWGDIVQDVDHVEGFSYGPSHDDVEKRRCNNTDS